MSAHTSDEWREIVEAIEESAPLYESISERISFNLASPLRRRAIAGLDAGHEEWVLDAGAGPGVSSRLLISQGFVKVVGLDPSRRLLRFASSRLGSSFEPVVGIIENLPFKSASFASSVTCFALRDVQNPGQSISEFARVIRMRGHLCIVDIGKPDRALARAFISFYIHYLMPRLAVVFIRRRINGNPFKMIVPTFDRLLSNGKLGNLTNAKFGPAKLDEFMLGGLIVVRAERRTNQ
jgi:demethylmenaquinone methyltransferase / 2-methoxy-6-polyprenyl-1,4-benzoquinol methylase